MNVKGILATGGFVAAMSIAGAAVAQDEPTTVETPGSEQTETPDVSVSYVDEAGSAAKKEKIWNFTLAPYLMFPFMNGSITLGNVTGDVNLNTGDVLKKLNWFLMLYFETRHPKFTLATDLLYMNLGQGGTVPVGPGRTADWKMQQLAAEVVFLGRIVKWFELGFGGRVNFVQSSLFSPSQAPIGPEEINVDLRKTWFDPLVVLRFIVPFKDNHWRLALRADVGGFAVGSTYAWQVYPYGGYNFDGINGKRVFELGAAFRAIGMKYETGSGDQRLVYDMIIWGPLLGFLFHF